MKLPCHHFHLGLTLLSPFPHHHSWAGVATVKVISKMPLPSLQAGAKAVTTSSTWAHSEGSCRCHLLTVRKEHPALQAEEPCDVPDAAR